MPANLTATRKRRLQCLCAQKLKEKKAEELRDRRFNELRPPPRQEWRPKPIEVEKPVITQDEDEDNLDTSDSPVITTSGSPLAALLLRRSLWNSHELGNGIVAAAAAVRQCGRGLWGESMDINIVFALPIEFRAMDEVGIAQLSIGPKDA
uniref:Retrotransposon protein, putative, unclassified n=2 Tax=Oryza sativa TaxID=4530 RepID=Q7XEM3_ORYSJ|nr:Hypothetical protein [Oryza sativa]AAP53765.1 retrotransposon protein, putative, unclassified [Oryza sativa Japonica Group]